jgi:hypothetical protein
LSIISAYRKSPAVVDKFPKPGIFYAFKSALPKIKAACDIVLKYSVLNNMLRRMKKYAEVFSKISACFRENLYKK